MPVKIDGLTYYRTLEVCARAGISRVTLYRWLKAGLLEKRLRDRRGWAIFSEEDIAKIRREAQKIEVQYFIVNSSASQADQKIKRDTP